MEISARVLREVEFNSSLRGYNTDEVDEFLEQVADAVDRLHGEAKAAAERAETAERTAQDRSGIEDEESIRRTLVLAQRTADMAIREAQEEAGQILDRARGEAETLVGDARDSAERITSDAERRLRDDVTRLSNARDALKTEVDTLVSLLGAERERLTETLGAALRYVERSLSPSGPLMSLQAVSAAPETGDAGSDNVGDADEGSEGGEDAEDAEDAAAAPDAVSSSSDAYSIVARPEIATASAETAAMTSGHGAEGPSDDGDGAVEPVEIDDLEAAIAEDAAAAAPPSGHETESDQYDWDSVIRGRTEPLFGDRPQVERANLTALPSLDDSTKDPAAAQMRARSTDWPA